MPLSDKKREYGVKLQKYIQEYNTILVVTVDNVGSNQMQQVRMALRGRAVILMGKNTTVRKVVKDFLKKHPGHPIENLMEHVQGNIGFVFTNDDVAKVRDIISENKVPAPARVGAIAPIDVFVEPGPTGCDPGQTGFFQALQIATKINRGQIEMVARTHLIKTGERVTESQSALLQKLNMKPFAYRVVVDKVYQFGQVFDAAVLDITETDMLAKFMFGVRTVAALSLSLGVPTLASFPHSVNNAFKTLVSIALGTDYKFPRAKEFEDFLANPGNFVVAAAAPAAAGGGGGAAAAKVEESESEESAGGAGGLFGGGDDDW